jgi:hypothetical protein
MKSVASDLYSASSFSIGVLVSEVGSDHILYGRANGFVCRDPVIFNQAT